MYVLTSNEISSACVNQVHFQVPANNAVDYRAFIENEALNLELSGGGGGGGGGRLSLPRHSGKSPFDSIP